VLAYIEQNGLKVSARWAIGQEMGSGDLFIRDLVASAQGIDARY